MAKFLALVALKSKIKTFSMDLILVSFRENEEHVLYTNVEHFARRFLNTADLEIT